MSFSTFLANSLALSFMCVLAEEASTTITGQVFCDNFCRIYFNGYPMLLDNAISRVVTEFTYETTKTSTRTISMWLGDWGYEKTDTYGIDYIAPTSTSNQFFIDLNGDGIDDVLNYWCLGGGGFRGVFKDPSCRANNEFIVTNSDFKCMAINIGPYNVDQCFDNGFYTNPTYTETLQRIDEDGHVFIKPDPCIANKNGTMNTEINDACEMIHIDDYDSDWLNPGYDDSDWDYATEFDESEVCLSGCIHPLATECSNENWYCNYDSESWGESSFIWSSDLNIDNIVLCRYEYECDDSTNTPTEEPTQNPAYI